MSDHRADAQRSIDLALSQAATWQLDQRQYSTDPWPDPLTFVGGPGRKRDDDAGRGEVQGDLPLRGL
jgi:hypothetical protein